MPGGCALRLTKYILLIWKGIKIRFLCSLMERGLLVVLCVGVGWVLGITIMMILLPLGGQFDYTFEEAMGNMLVFGFPGFLMFMIALIMSTMNPNSNPFEENFTKSVGA